MPWRRRIIRKNKPGKRPETPWKSRCYIILGSAPFAGKESSTLPEFQKFSGGNRGSSFRATPEQYATILKIGTQAQPQFFKYAPGEQAYNWQKDYVAGEARLGYTELKTGSLARFATLEALNLHLGFPAENKSNKTWSRWFLLKSAREGDVVFATKGAMRVEGVGIVQGPYRYEPKEAYPHVRPVHRLTADPWEYAPNLFPGYPQLFRADPFAPTLLGPEIIGEYLKVYPQHRTLFRQHGIALEEEALWEEAEAVPHLSALNTILYGPPGTGKTYMTITRAVKIATGKDLPHAEAKSVSMR